ncbi:cilia- and flagella-associated protein 161-like [Scaptodrosophila lebanonensis]|uniref:Cilia- and flagella-associated protein 161-like n=1 Tax=Drosophila lebanonensis TaxID=7225 RepID=A0A6J2UJM3_DROLE|nr:cilia- and flagella-associated protein 161-like [Scaptodrosophila lebanonensis]
MPCIHILLDSGSSRYGPKTLMGNWVEDRFLKEDNVRQVQSKHSKGTLLIEKTRRFFDRLYKEITFASTEYLKFGGVVQVKPLHLNIADHDTSEFNPALSVIINERVLMHSEGINEECELTVASSDRPCVRNCFRLISGDEKDRTNEVLKYGQHFRLECIEPNDDPIWVYSAPKFTNLLHPIKTNFSSTKRGELNNPLGLVYRSNCGPGQNVPSAHANWFCMHFDPLRRFESEGKDVPFNSKVLIVHAVTNKNLAVENVSIHTLFGEEFLVSVQNYYNVYKQVTWKNLWMIGGGLKHT